MRCQTGDDLRRERNKEVSREGHLDELGTIFLDLNMLPFDSNLEPTTQVFSPWKKKMDD